ncbi:MAG: cell division protein FtsQ/DivIB [Suipraeoptans sp.]
MKRDDTFKEQYEEYYEEAEELPKRKRKKRLGVRIYHFFTGLIGFAIIVVGTYVLFFIQDVSIEGNEYTDTNEIRETVLNDEYSFNSIYVWAKYKLDKGNDLPTINSIKVSIRKPWVLNIKVNEKKIVGYIETEKGYTYFDIDGMVVNESRELKEGVPKIEGLDLGTPKLYSKLDANEKNIFDEIIKTTEEVEKNNINTEKIIYRDGSIYLNQGNIYISLGTSITSEQIAQIPPILEKLVGQEGTLHLENYSANTESISFRKGEFPSEN